MPKTIPAPLAQAHAERGAPVSERPYAIAPGAYPTPERFGALEDELRALSEGAALADLTGRAILEVSGRDRHAWLHGLCTQEIKALKPGEGAYACHIDIKGRILTDMRVSVEDERFLLDMEPGEGDRMRRAFKRFIVMEQVKVKDLTAKQAALGLVGPQAAEILHGLTGEARLLGLPVHHHLRAAFGDIAAHIAATDQLGPLGFRITCARDDAAALWALLLDAGAGAVVPVGEQALEAARVRAGRPRLGHDLTDAVLFNEALLHDAVSFTKGCYLGQEIVERVDARGRVGRKLLGLRLPIDHDQLPAPGATVSNTSRKLGALTSVAWLPDAGYAVALAFLHRADNAPGTQLIVRATDDGPELAAWVTERSGLGTPPEAA